MEEEGNFYVVTNKVPTWEVNDKTGTKTYIELNEESYEVKATVSGDDIDDLEAGDVVLAKFDSKDRVKEIIIVADAVVTEDYTFAEITSGDVNDDEILDDNNYIGAHKVTSSTIVYTITPVEDEDDEDVIDHYTVEVSKGTTELKGVEAAIVAVDNEDSFKKAAFVFVWEEAKNTEKTFGIVEKYSYTKGTEYLTIDGTKYEVDEDQVGAEGMVGKLVAFVENDDVIKISLAYGVDELAKGAIVTDVEDRVIETTKGTFDLDVLEDKYEDYKVLFATVTEDVEDDTYEFTDCEEIKYSEIKVKKEDVIAETKADSDVDVILIIRGYDAE